MSCELASEVTRRDGPAIACQTASAQADCQSLFQALRETSLAHQGMEHDLTVVPSSLLKKIQVGGIIALQFCIQDKGQLPDSAENIENLGSTPIESINAVVQTAKAKFQLWSSLDLTQVASFIASFPLQRRRQSRKTR